MTDAPDLPEMPVWQARSFWFAVATAIGIILNALGYAFDVSLWTDRLMALVPLITLALTYRERLSPTVRLVWRRPR